MYEYDEHTSNIEYDILTKCWNGNVVIKRIKKVRKQVNMQQKHCKDKRKQNTQTTIT